MLKAFRSQRLTEGPMDRRRNRRQAACSPQMRRADTRRARAASHLIPDQASVAFRIEWKAIAAAKFADQCAMVEIAISMRDHIFK